MSTYREIHGKAVKSLDTDPSATTDEGQIWYNTSSDTFKTILVTEAWASAAPLMQKRTDPSGFGTQTANVCATGNIPPRTAVTEEYNGIGWSGGGTASQAGQYRAGFGTLTAGVIAGARTPAPAASNATEEYDGSSWTAGGNLPASIYLPGNQAAGTLTAGLTFGGDTGPGASFPTASYEYNGTGWTAGNPTNTARSFGAGSGSQTAAFFACGTTPPFSPSNDSVHFEQYDGTNWATGPNLNSARISTAAGGDTTAGIVFGGEIRPGPAVSNKLEKWDGTSWTTSPATMGTGRMGTGRALGTGSATANIASGGYTTTPVNTTEEYNLSANVITAGAWSSGPNMITGRAAVKGAGTQLAAWALGGETAPGPTVNSTENFDGSSWTAGGAFPATTRSAFTCGTQTAGLGAGGNSSPGQTPYNTASAEYDGSSWTASPGALSPGKGYGAMSGVQTTALATGGDGPTNPSHPFAQVGVQSYNGSSWSSETNYPTTFYGGTGAGISETAAVVWGGSAPYPGTNPSTADYNGSSWTLVATTITNAGAPSTSGCQGTNQSPATSCGSMGGTSGGVGFFQWNDTAWSTLPNMGTGGDRGGAGTLTAAIAFGGYHPGEPRMNDTEEYTPESTAVNVKTLTQS